MQDRLRFRAWDKVYKRMFEVFSFNENFVHSAIGNDPAYTHNQVILMQCTGLKDKNGKLIFEGDVVTYEWLTPLGKVWRNDGKYIVEWSAGFGLLSNIAEYDVKHGTIRNVKIIGNIYENPELLNKEE